MGFSLKLQQFVEFVATISSASESYWILVNLFLSVQNKTFSLSWTNLLADFPRKYYFKNYSGHDSLYFDELVLTWCQSCNKSNFCCLLLSSGQSNKHEISSDKFSDKIHVLNMSGRSESSELSRPSVWGQEDFYDISWNIRLLRGCILRCRVEMRTMVNQVLVLG